MKLFKYIVISPLLLFLSCKKENMFDMLKRTGKIVKETRDVKHVRYFAFGKGKMNFYFTQNPVFKVEVEAGKNLIGLIKTEVKGDTLYIDNHNRCNFTRSYKPQINIYISTPDLRKIVQRGVGEIKSTNTITGDTITLETWNSSCDIYFDVNCECLISHAHNSTAIYATGYAKTHLANMWHNCTFFGEDLTTENTSVFDNTTGNFYCKVNNQLDAFIELSGDVIYSGNPIITVNNIGGTGKVMSK